MIERIGMYRKDGHIFKVQKAVHGSGNLYAKELVDTGEVTTEGKPVFKFEYAKGAIYSLTAADQMTLAQAREFGAIYGVCCVCGVLLTDEKSIEAGIGPVCAKGDRFADPEAVKLYAEDLGQGEDVAPEPAPQTRAPAREIGLSSNRYGPVFVVRWAYDDPQFAAIKAEVKQWSWEDTKRTWDKDIRAWTFDAKSPVSIAILSDFAARWGFIVSPEAEARMADRPSNVRQIVETKPAATDVPLTFEELARQVS